MKKPNVIFILADDLGYGDLACFGNDAVRTPNIDRLAQSGVMLWQHYSASSLCAPARAALLTGRYNHRTGAVDVCSNRGLDRIALDERLMPEYFHDVGYTTGMIGKWHNGLHDMRHHPRSRGFDEFVGFLNGGMDYYEWALDWNGETKYSDGRYLTDVFTEASLDFILRQSGPFFLYLAYNAPHAPLQAPEDKVAYYRSLGRFNEQVCTIYAMIEQMDDGLGKIFQCLEKQGLCDDTIIVFTSDNGPAFAGGAERWNGPFSGSKGSVLEGGIRVPAIVSWPRHIPSGEDTDAVIHFCDWLPTLLSWIGIEPQTEKPLDGLDRSIALSGQDDGIKEIRFWQRNRYAPVACCNAAMRDGDWKLVMPMRGGADQKVAGDQGFYEHGLKVPHWLMEVNHTFPQREIGPELQPQLFDITADPEENCDLADCHPEKVSMMQCSWNLWFQEVEAEWEKAYRGNVQF